jgi:hypothetical protein
MSRLEKAGKIMSKTTVQFSGLASLLDDACVEKKIKRRAARFLGAN